MPDHSALQLQLPFHVALTLTGSPFNCEIRACAIVGECVYMRGSLPGTSAAGLAAVPGSQLLSGSVEWLAGCCGCRSCQQQSCRGRSLRPGMRRSSIGVQSFCCMSQHPCPQSRRGPGHSLPPGCCTCSIACQLSDDRAEGQEQVQVLHGHAHGRLSVCSDHGVSSDSLALTQANSIEDLEHNSCLAKFVKVAPMKSKVT